MAGAKISSTMDRHLFAARAVAMVATAALVPTVVLAPGSRLFTASAILAIALLASATAYAVYLGLYRFPR